MIENKCRLCGHALVENFVDLGMSPLANSYVAPDRADHMEPFYPLHAYVCHHCWLVQLAHVVRPEDIFHDYLYFSSFSDSWLRHCEAYTTLVTDRFKLGSSSHVIEVASNDGYLLQFFQKRGIPVLGIEPAANVAAAAEQKGIPTDVAFFGVATAQRLKAAGKAADLIAAKNVLAHVPDLNDFVGGFKVLLKPSGVVTVEFPHLLRLMNENQFDTIYHEHFSYLSFSVAERAFARHGLVLFDVDEIPTHGGSLRIYGRHAEDSSKPVTSAVERMRAREQQAGLDGLGAYRQFANQVADTKCAVLEFFIAAKRSDKKVAGYGAPAKGNTLLNYCGIRTDMIGFTVDRSPHKQGMLLPGTHIPILAPDAIFEAKPDYVFILPWNLKDEIAEQMAKIRDWGGKFVAPIPTIRVF
jgi:SAM-dependent methyltransferase